MASGAMPVVLDPSEFRRVMGHFATGVTVITSQRDDEAPVGLTANSVASLSLDPMLLLICLDRGSQSRGWIERRGAFAVNVLDGDSEALARRFAGRDSGVRFEGLAYRQERTGCPVLQDALAWLDCEVAERLDGGDHTIFLGRVCAMGAREGSPLLYYRGGYARLVP